MGAFVEITNGLATRWVDAMWPTIWQSAVLAGVVYLLTLCLRRLSAAVRFWLWMLVPLRLLVMPLITVSLPLLPAQTQLESVHIERMSAEMVIAEPAAVRGIETARVAEEFEPMSTAMEKEYLVSTRVWPNTWALLMWAWMVGIAFWSIRLIGGWCKIRHIANNAVEVSEGKVLALTQKAATMLGLRRIPRILVTEESVSPFLFGVLRPALVIPAGLVGKVRGEALFAVFAHEFAHLRRQDPLVGWVLAICEVIYFFHPVFYFVKRLILFERERACDDWVVATSKARRSIYANALISAADVCRTFSTNIGPAGVVAESFGDLKKRLIAIYSNSRPKTRLSMTALILLIIIGVICVPGIVLTACQTTRAEGETAQAVRGITPSETIEPVTLPSGLSSSRAWHILRQWNVGPLLLGLSQRLGKVTDSSQRDDRVWTGVTNGGRLQLNIAVEGDTSGEIFIGFFENPTWSAEPVQVRSFPRAGQHTIDSLPPGKFQIGAMIGKLPVAAALGVHRTWPEPVEIKAGVATVAEVLVSEDFHKRSSGWYNQEVSRDYIEDWKDIDTDNLLQGRVTGPAGQPIAFATVQVREHNPGARSIAAPNCGTSEQGFYKCDRIAWPYRVGVIWYEPIPPVFGYRHQYLMYNRIFEDSHTVDFQFDSFPKGDAKLNGRVLDENGNPLKEFFIDVRTRMNWDVTKNPEGKFYKIVGYRVSFVSNDGTFELGGLPDGDVRARVIPFQNQVYESHRGEEIVLLAGKTSTVEFKITAKNVLFGRVLFEDGSPAVIKPARWPGAKTSIIMSTSIERGRRAHVVANVDDDGYFTVYLNEKEIEQLRSGKSSLIINVPMKEKGRRKSMGKFPFELLARDKNQTGVLKIEHPMGEPQSIVDEPLPKFEGIEIEFNPEQAKGKNVLVCFWDMDQRPLTRSMRLIMELAKREKELEEKGVVVLLVHTSEVDVLKPQRLLKSYRIPFACGRIKSDAERVLFRWGGGKRQKTETLLPGNIFKRRFFVTFLYS